MDRPYHVVDAFTGKRYAGNAAAVVLDAEGLSDAQMQSIAAEFNLSETTFVLGLATDKAPVRFRWFTPTTEVAMCGHATIAGVHALVEAGRLDDCGLSATDHGLGGDVKPAADNGQSAIAIETLAGILTACIEDLPGSKSGRVVWLDLPKPVLIDYPIPRADLSGILNLPSDAFDSSLPSVRSQDNDALVFVKDALILNEVRPDFARLKEFQQRRRLRGLCLATTGTLTKSIHVQSRFFAPVAGVEEDPVTGSVHGPLAAYLTTHGLAPMENRTGALMCTQAARGRAGLVYALVHQEDDGTISVRIGGQAVTTMRGTLVD